MNKIRFDLRDQENMDYLLKTKLRICGKKLNELYKMCDISLPIQEIQMDTLIERLRLNPRQCADLLEYF